MRREASIAIVSDNSWRAVFLARLLKRVCNVTHRNDGVGPPSDSVRDVDFLLWDRKIDNPDVTVRDHRGLFVFDYTAEGSAHRVEMFCREWSIPHHRGLLLLPRKSDSRIGCLPLPPPKSLGGWSFTKPMRLEDRDRELLFLCAPTALRLPEDFRPSAPCELPYCKWHRRDQRLVYNQRLEWAERLSEAGMLTDGNGLVEAERPDLKESRVREAYAFGVDAFVKRVRRGDFHKRITESRLVLSPAGHSRWAYRHVESMYNRALTISTDLSGHRSLPDLPAEALIMIPDGGFDPHFVRNLAQHAPDYQRVADAGFDFARSNFKACLPLNPYRDRKDYEAGAAKRVARRFLEELQALLHHA